MAKAQGVRPGDGATDLVRRRGLKPHLVKTFKLSNDPKFRGESSSTSSALPAPAGQRRWVLCMDEKSSIQALDRTQASFADGQGPGRHDDA